MTANENEIVVYQPDDTTRLSVRFDGETVWLSQEQMIELFQRDRSVISRHIANAFKEGEALAGKSISAFFNGNKAYIPPTTEPANGRWLSWWNNLFTAGITHGF